jgi:hypothetical protein
MRYLGLTRHEKPPRMACVHARYSRRHLHDHSGQCSCPTDSFGRPDPDSPTAATPSSRTTPLLLRETVYEGASDHDREALAQSRRTALGELLAVLEEQTPQMQKVRQLLSEGGRFPSKRTFERRLKALPNSLAEQRSAVWDATWWKCSSPGRVAEELGKSCSPPQQHHFAGKRWSVAQERQRRSWHTVAHTSIDTEAGWRPRAVGTAGWCMGRSYTWPSASVRIGSRFVPGSPPPTTQTTRWPRT